jgi:glycosyl transferase family 25
MRTFVINLEGQSDRRDITTSNLNAAHVEFSIFPAVFGKNTYREYFDSINNWGCLLETGHFITLNEIGCYASHLTLWKKCVELDEAIIIMEDDFRLGSEFDKTITFANNLIESCGFIRLEPIESRWARKPGLEPIIVLEDTSSKLIYQRMPSIRTTCYAITPTCAAALISHSKTVSCPVDYMVRKHWVHGQPIFAITPPAIELAELASQSSIGERDKHIARHLISPFRLLYRYAQRRRARRSASLQLTAIRQNPAFEKYSSNTVSK